MKKFRLDILLTERKLTESRSAAQRLIMAGEVQVNGQLCVKPAEQFAEDALIEIRARPKYVSRGGEKLEAALIAFGRTNLPGSVCADVGASTGGFTDCLLQHGASMVFAIDVGYGQLDFSLRSDPRVVVMERTNIRDVTQLPQPISLATIDASFISLKTILPGLLRLEWTMGADIIALIKPQFEAGREEAARGKGVIRDKTVHARILKEILSYCESLNLGIYGLVRSPVIGPKGNIEFLLGASEVCVSSTDPASLIHRALAE